MSKKGKQQMRQPPLPPLFVLPDDIPVVETWARALAIECAYLVIRDKRQKVIGALGPQVMAVNSCMELEKLEYEGKRGSNNPALYRNTCIPAFLARYPLAYDEVLTGQIAIDPAWSESERVTKLYVRELVAQGILTEQ